eukprot:69898-Hanusia_phi.AAC.1
MMSATLSIRLPTLYNGVLELCIPKSGVDESIIYIQVNELLRFTTEGCEDTKTKKIGINNRVKDIMQKQEDARKMLQEKPQKPKVIRLENIHYFLALQFKYQRNSVPMFKWDIQDKVNSGIDHLFDGFQLIGFDCRDRLANFVGDYVRDIRNKSEEWKKHFGMKTTASIPTQLQLSFGNNGTRTASTALQGQPTAASATAVDSTAACSSRTATQTVLQQPRTTETACASASDVGLGSTEVIKPTPTKASVIRRNVNSKPRETEFGDDYHLDTEASDNEGDVDGDADAVAESSTFTAAESSDTGVSFEKLQQELKQMKHSPCDVTIGENVANKIKLVIMDSSGQLGIQLGLYVKDIHRYLEVLGVSFPTFDDANNKFRLFKKHVALDIQNPPGYGDLIPLENCELFLRQWKRECQVQNFEPGDFIDGITTSRDDALGFNLAKEYLRHFQANRDCTAPIPCRAIDQSVLNDVPISSFCPAKPQRFLRFNAT